MLQRTHFELVRETPQVLSDHKKLERKKRNRRNRKHKRNIVPIVVDRNKEQDEPIEKKIARKTVKNTVTYSEIATITGMA